MKHHCAARSALLLAVFAATVGIGVRHAAAESLARFEFREPHMGTQFRLTFYAEGEDAANRAAKVAFDRVRQLNSILSDYDSESELSRLSRTAGSGMTVRLSTELFTVLAASQKLAQKTQGAFDVTVGPLVKLWRRARRSGKLPEEEKLTQAGESVGYRWLELEDDPPAALLKQSDMRLDLGGIAKGYAADEALAVLARHGITRAMIDAGGDLAVGAPPPEKDGWRIGVAPLKADARPSRYLSVHHCGVATSGDAFQYVEIDGHRHSHILDPRTGLGLTTRSSVTVIAPDAMTADSLASALSVLGPQASKKLIADRAKTEFLFVARRKDGLEIITSAGFDQYLVESR